MEIKTLLKKELLDGVRNYRFIIIFAAVFFFAILDPVLNKLVLPEVLRSQFPDMPEALMNEMLFTTQVANIRGFLGNVYQLSSLIIAFSISGIMAQEISEKTLIFPVCTGKSFASIVAAKLFVYGSCVITATTLGAMINYFYAGVLFEFGLPSAIPALRAGLLNGTYMIYMVAILIFMGALARKAIPAGLLTLLLYYGTRLIGDLFNIHNYLPSGLLIEAELLAAAPSLSFIAGSLATTVALIIILSSLTVVRLSSLELTRG